MLKRHFAAPQHEALLASRVAPYYTPWRMKRIPLYFLLLLSACASPQSQPYEEASLEPRLEKHILVASDGARLPYRAWLPEKNPRAVIVALHGFNDYSHAFEIPGEYMRLRGVAVYAYDQRGFGLTPSTGVWAGEENLLRDAADMVNAVHARYPGTPLYLLGESMGGAVAIDAVTSPGFPEADGLILSAPAIWGGETMNPLFRLSLWTFAHVNPKKQLTGEDLHILASDNIDMLRALGGDPLVIKGTRVDTIWGLVRLMDHAYDRFGLVKMPTLVLYGAHDQVIPPEPIRKAMHKAGKETTIAYYPLGYHMLLRDLHGDVPVRDMLAWMKNPARGLPSGHDLSAKKFLK
jgi:acylglycerol lipase